MFTNDLANRLMSTLVAIEIGEDVIDDDIEALSELATVAIEQAASDGSFGGFSGPVSVRSMHDAPVLDPANDLLMVAHVREFMKSKAAASMRTRAGRATASGNVPYEDRGKTVRDASALTEAASLQASGGPAPESVAQWIPIGLWALRTIGKVLKKRRENKGK